MQPRWIATQIAVLALCSAQAPAQPLIGIGYQGKVELNDGTEPLGIYQFRFRVFDHSLTGSQVGTDAFRFRFFQTGNNGFFTFHDLYFGTDVFVGSDRWVEVSTRLTDTDPWDMLSPRQAMALTPAAVYAQTSGTDLDTAYTNGSTIMNDGLSPVIIQGAITIGSDTTTGLLELFSTDTGTSPALRLSTNSAAGGKIELNDNTGTPLATIQADDVDPGANFSITGDASTLAWSADPNGPGSRLLLTGNANAIVLAPNSSKDSTVQLPDGAISALETLEEPGFANDHTSSVALNTNGSMTVVLSRSLTVPTDGYVLVIIDGNLSWTHANGTGSDIFFGVSERPTAFNVDTDHAVALPAAAASGRYEFPTSSSGLYTVTPGTHTFYFLGLKIGNTPDPTIFDPQLTLLFVPTNYGTINTNTPVPPPLLDPTPFNTAPVQTGLTLADIRAEYQAELLRYAQEVDARFQAQEQQVQALQEQLKAIQHN